MSDSLAFVFPGQGSQSIGMLADLAKEYSEVKETFEQASDVLGFNLWTLVQDGPEGDLNLTYNTQPAMLAAGVAVWRIWQSQNGKLPEVMAGHSLGEYTALVCSNAIDYEKAVGLVAKRGQFMQKAVPTGVGAMAAVLGLEDDLVREACEKSAEDEVVAPVNYNSPGQIVIAGHKAAVERALASASDMGAKKAVMLPVSVPSHCSLMQPAAEALLEVLTDAEIRSPEIPVIQNVDVESHASPETIRELLARQLYLPVRWVETIQTIAEQGVTGAVECGPGKVLMGLNRRIDRKVATLPVFDPAGLQKALEKFA